MSAQAEELAPTAEQLKSLVARSQLETQTDKSITPRRRADDWGTGRRPAAPATPAPPATRHPGSPPAPRSSSGRSTAVRTASCIALPPQRHQENRVCSRGS